MRRLPFCCGGGLVGLQLLPYSASPLPTSVAVAADSISRAYRDGRRGNGRLRRDAHGNRS